MKKNEINKITGEVDLFTKDNPAKVAFSGIWNFIKTVFFISLVAGIILGVASISYLVKLSQEPTGIDLDAKSLNQTSFIYVQDTSTSEFYQYQELYSQENRVWLDFNQIPESMKEAIIAIEDKRFESHHGVDWFRTGSAVISLLTGSESYGGSTLTQQLVKNITDDDAVSITRKLREIFRALNLEKEYTKDQILEAYLNIVNFGGNCQGIEAASQLYFGHSATECSLAECASIVGITQNPSKWNPLIYPENNKIRREVVLGAMLEQEKITQSEYDAAMAESASMTFVGYSTQTVDEIVYDDDDEDYSDVQNWYIDATFRQLAEDLAVYYNISEDAAADKIYTEGLKIYCAMDLDAQNMMQQAALDIDKSSNSDLQIGMTMTAYDGRIIATVGSSVVKTGALVWDRANASVLQAGSSIKPIIVYPYSIQKKLIHFSSMIKDEPLEEWGDTPGPNNWYRYYQGYLTTFDAIDWSSNACAVQLMSMIGPGNAFEQATTKMGFEHLTDIDAEILGGLSIGGLDGGVTVREMASAISYIGNGGMVYSPYTYYYVTDANDNIILDNRNNVGVRAYDEETATIMNRLLYYNVSRGQQTAAVNAAVPGWEIAGKTGTTDDYYDSWFVGASPYASMAIWCGFDDPHSISGGGTSVASQTFAKVMGKYLENKEYKSFELSDNVVTASYCTDTGLLASDICGNTMVGYYTTDNMPDTCSAQSHSYYQTETTAPTTQATTPSETSQPTTAPPSEETDPTVTEPSESQPTEPSEETTAAPTDPSETSEQ